LFIIEPEKRRKRIKNLILRYLFEKNKIDEFSRNIIKDIHAFKDQF
jgi:hypothetical protein